MESEKEKIVILCGKDVKSLGEIDADYIVIFDRGCEVNVNELTSLAEKMMRNDGVTAIVSTGGFISKFNSLLYAVAAGKKIPVPAGAVGFSGDVAKSLAGAERYDAVSLIMEAASLGIKTHSVSPIESRRPKTSKLILRLWSLFLSSHILKYIFSSVVAAVIDYILLLVLTDVLGGILPSLSMEVAALLAWVVSSLSNFAINRNFVFRSSARILPAMGEYYALAAPVFVIKSYGLIELLTRVISVPLWIAKPIAEVAFFITNYFIQKKLIFKKK